MNTTSNPSDLGDPSDPLYGAPLSALTGVFVYSRYTAVISPAILIHDLLLTIDDEIRLVWPGPLTLPKTLYYLNRYLSTISTTYIAYRNSGLHPPSSDLSCRIVNWCSIIPFAVVTAAATGMLCLRVVALYKSVRWVIWTTWFGFTVSHVIRTTIDLIGASTISASMAYSNIGRQCLPGKSGKIGGGPIVSIIYAVIPTAFDLFLLTLTLVKSMKTTGFSHSHPSASIMRTLLSHEILYFLIITVVRSCVGIFSMVFPVTFLAATSNVEWGVESALLSRFFLHLRSIYIDRHAIVPSQTGASSTRTHPFGRGANRLTGGVSIKLETETNIYDKFPNQNERGIPPVETVDFEAAMELRARHHEDLDL